MRRLFLFPLFLVGVLFLACSEISCPVQTSVVLNYALRQPINDFGDSRTDTLKEGDTLWIWTQRADGKDTLIYNRGVSVTTVALPVSGTHPEDMHVFYFADSVSYVIDTIWVKKEDRPHFESVDCQAAFFHTITDVRYTHHRIDSVTIHEAGIDFDYTVSHLYLFLKK